MAPKRTKCSDSSVHFQWSDDEIELLLAVVYDYKTCKDSEEFDWESIKNKYEDIKEIFLAKWPANVENADDEREFNHSDPNKEFTKERIVTKIKSLRLKYRSALDSGRRSGWGRVVAQFYDICSSIWSGSPAAEAIDGGIDCSDAKTSTFAETTSLDTSNSTPVTPYGITDDESEDAEVSNHGRRDLVRHLKESKNSRLNKKIPVDKQMLDLTKRDFELKRDMMEHMKHMDEEHNKQLKALSESMVSLTHALTAAINNRQQPVSDFPQHVRPDEIQPAQYPQPNHRGTIAGIIIRLW